jgi:hypothetical protein
VSDITPLTWRDGRSAASRRERWGYILALINQERLQGTGAQFVCHWFAAAAAIMRKTW